MMNGTLRINPNLNVQTAFDANLAVQTNSGNPVASINLKVDKINGQQYTTIYTFLPNYSCTFTISVYNTKNTDEFFQGFGLVYRDESFVNQVFQNIILFSGSSDVGTATRSTNSNPVIYWPSTSFATPNMPVRLFFLNSSLNDGPYQVNLMLSALLPF